MSRRLKVTAIVFCVIAILAAVIISTVALAGSPESDVAQDAGPGQVFISKVAGILGLDETTVANAFKQARQEMRAEAQEKCLQQAIDDGRITEEEAAQIRDWWQDRPESLEQIGPAGCLGMRRALENERNGTLMQ